MLGFSYGKNKETIGEKRMSKKFNPEIDEHDIECNCDDCLDEHIAWKKRTGRLPSIKREKK